MNQALAKSDKSELAATNENNSVSSIISMIERAALNPEVDVDKMERLMNMQERIFNKQAEIEYSKSMATIQSTCQVVAADSHNAQTNSNYASLGATLKKITPIYSKAGFALSFGNDESPLDQHVRVVCDCMHISGFTRQYFYDSPIDDKGIKGTTNKTPQHGRASAINYGRRYLTNMIFNLAVGIDDDGNGSCNPVEVISASQVADLKSLIQEKDLSESKVLVWLNKKGIASFDEIPAADFSNIIKAIS